MSLYRILCLAALSAALSPPCLAKPGSEPDGLGAAVERHAERRKVNGVAKSQLKDGMVTLTYADGTVVSEPVKRVVQPGRVVGAVNVSLALKRLEKAAYAAAKLAPDATAEEKVAVLDALGEQAGKKNVAGILALAAAAALAARAALKRGKA
jgi:hypothetical protein